ncbi:MAG: apolipoprotein N-acyltransferase [Bacteroidetes bacterium]|nr:apolipoprotein N-acyltransferase [Bacteroidota bacterium]
MPAIFSNRILLSLITGLFLWLAWSPSGFAPLLFVAWVPLLLLEHRYYSDGKLSKKSLFGFVYLSFVAWNVLTTWWVYFASDWGSLVAFLVNSLFMATVFMLFHFTHCRIKKKWAYISLPVYWIAFEYLHLNWELSWPWLTLGNGFAAYAPLVQWYEFTGALGGSLWVLETNIVIAIIIITKNKKEICKPVAFIAVPVILSLLIHFNYSEKTNPVHVVVVQPNVDPYNDKFSGMSNEEQLSKILRLGFEKITDSTQYLVAPETAIPYSMWEDRLEEYEVIKTLRKILEQFPKLKIVIGASTNYAYVNGESPSVTARLIKKENVYYDSYNTALQIEKEKPIQIFHKSKLVPGVERMPYPSIFGFLETLAIDLGGTAGSLGTQPHPSVFTSNENIIAPVICYESVYGGYVSEYINKNASLIFIITNDGWWRDTPGYKQHLQYARLRAIEMRRSIARSANTGISAFINQRGDVQQPTHWWKEDVIETAINKNEELTIYAKHGDYLGVIAALLVPVFLILSFIKKRQ